MTAAPEPTRPQLIPGLRVIEEPGEHLRIGSTPDAAGTALRLAATPAVRRTLSALDRGEVPAEATTARVLRRLAPVLLDGDRLLCPGIDPGDVAAAAAREPDRFTDRLRARRQSRVLVRGDLGVGGRAGGDAIALLTAAGIDCVSPGTAADVVLVTAIGEVDREPFDQWRRDGTATLLVRLVGTDAVIGPLTVPGRTACLRCLDLYAAAQDPRHPMLVARHLAAVRHDGVAEPVDSALAALAVAWAVRDVVSFVEGTPAATWSRTVRITADLTSVTRTHWPRHPGCGCVWDGPEASRPVPADSDRSEWSP